MAKYDCHACKKQVTGTKSDRYRSHSDGGGEPCGMSSEPIPEHILAQPVGQNDDPSVPREGVDFAVCPQCERKVQLTRMGYFEPHDSTLRGGDRCEVSGVRARHARKMDTVPLPGDEPLPPSAAVPEVKAQDEVVRARGLALPVGTEPAGPAPGAEAAATASEGARSSESVPPPGTKVIEGQSVGPLTMYAPPVGSGASMEESSPESSTTSKDSPRPSRPSTESGTPSGAPGSPGESASADEGPPVLHLAPLLDDVILQPFSHIFQPFPVPQRLRIQESMSDRGKEIAARLRETFYAYTNRNTRDNRSAQTTIGPSEAGSPCDRQIAMKLLGITPVNPQEGWAPFVGTAVHVELAKMFEWANGAQSGRYVTEMRVSFNNPYVPYGTLDLLDRVLYMVDDHKLMGRWSLDQLIQKGPSETYRVQAQIYGLGATLAGEKVKEVAIIGWPRQESSLDKLYVHVEKFDRKIAEAALARVARIAADAQRLGVGPHSKMEVAQRFPVGDDCKWCIFHLKGDKEMKRGCPGK